MQRTAHFLARHARLRFATTSLYVDGAAAAASDGQIVKTHSPLIINSACLSVIFFSLLLLLFLNYKYYRLRV